MQCPCGGYILVVGDRHSIKNEYINDNDVNHCKVQKRNREN